MEYEKNSEYSYCLGMSPLIEGLRHRPETIEKVYLSSRAKENASLEEMLRLCRERSIPVETDDKRIARLSVKENCFAIGIFRKFADRLQGSCHILLSAFEDEGFLGTTLRSAVSFDQKEIALIGCHADVFDPRTVRASMGAIFHCHLCVFPTLEEYSAWYPGQRIYTYAPDAQTEIGELKTSSHCSFLMQEKGLPAEDCRTYSIRKQNPQELSPTMIGAITFERLYSLRADKN
ncbi:MAG: hypothetical protein IKF18_07305 [Erysipelotrichaceae bacterium]|nr:hypothetical protein [Erysipelotrichaceae bacterium]